MPVKHQCPSKHDLLETDFCQVTSEWFCDVCGSPGSSRWRCISGCDYDVCRSCIGTRIPSTFEEIGGHAYKQAPTFLLGAAAPSRREVSQALIPHQHYVAYIDFQCNECKKCRRSNRLFCPRCSYDKCFSCKAKSEQRRPEGQLKRFELPSDEPFASGISRHAYKVMVGKSDGSFDACQSLLLRIPINFLPSHYR